MKPRRTSIVQHAAKQAPDVGWRGCSNGFICSSPAWKITIVGATLCLNKGLPIKSVQRTESIHEHHENWMWLANAKPQVSSLQNPKHILNEGALVGGLHSNLIKFVKVK